MTLSSRTIVAIMVPSAHRRAGAGGAGQVEGERHGLGGVVGAHHVIVAPAAAGQLPGVEAHDGDPRLQGQGDLRQRAELSRYGHHRVGGADHEGVAGLPQPGGDGHGDVRVGVGPVGPGEDPDGQPVGGLCAATGRFHHTAQPPAHEDGAGLGDAPAHVLGQCGLGVGHGPPAPDHGDVGHSHRNVAAAARGAAMAQTTSTSQAQPGTESPRPTLR